MVGRNSCRVDSSVVVVAAAGVVKKAAAAEGPVTDG